MYDKIINAFIENTIIGSLLILAVFLFSAPFKKSKIFNIRYWIWLIIAVRMIIPFKIQFPEKHFEIPITVTGGMPEMFNIQYLTDEFNNAIVLNPENLTTPNFFGIIKFIWLAGLVIYAVYYIYCYMLIKHSFKKNCSTITNNQVLNIFDNISRELKIRNKPEIMFCKKTLSPLTIGFLQPTIVLPERHYNDEDLNMIIKHELTHIKRRDNWYKLFMIIAKSPHWFNPIVHLMVNAADNDMELYCDNDVIRNEDMDYKKNYSSLIISYVNTESNKMPHGSAVYLFHNKNFIKKRIDCILKKSSLNKKITVSVLLMFTVIVASSFAYSESIQDSDNSHNNSNISEASESIINKKYIKPVDSHNIVIVDGKYIIFATEKGTDINAIYDGTVDSYGYHFSFGNYIKIKGTDNIDIVYCHLENIGVSEKQNIKKGQTIGTSGISGYASVNSCGIRAYMGEERIDITEYMNFTDNDKVVNIDNLSYSKANTADKEALFSK